MTADADKEWTFTRFQRFIKDAYGAKDSARGIEGTFMWFTAEVGELAEALRGGHDREAVAKEFADVAAWLATLANIAGVDLGEAIEMKYGGGCPYCGKVPCICGPAAKP